MLNISELLSEERSLGVFLVLTVVMGGGAAYLTGRAIASAWRPWWHAALYLLLLGAAVRFIHFALFQSKLLSLHYYLVDVAACLLFGWLGFRRTRVRQMVTRYNWINERASFLGWRRRDASGGTESG